MHTPPDNCAQVAPASHRSVCSWTLRPLYGNTAPMGLTDLGGTTHVNILAPSGLIWGLRHAHRPLQKKEPEGQDWGWVCSWGGLQPLLVRKADQAQLLSACLLYPKSKVAQLFWHGWTSLNWCFVQPKVGLKHRYEHYQHTSIWHTSML